MRGAAGQSTIEVVALVPLCVACALAVVSAGIAVRDQAALADAAGRAASAELGGRDSTIAALGALPETMRGGAEVSAEQGSVVVSAPPSARMLRLAGVRRLSATAVYDEEVAR